MKDKHTPGPWTIEREELGIDFSDKEQAEAFPIRIGPVAYWEHDISGAGEEAVKRIEADALLIAAAPDLLAAMDALLARIGCDRLLRGAMNHQIKAAKAAVAKARGRK